ncbi:hypothetical protein Droror1_Dr00017265 [Drosera rotundifolia]
MEMEVGSVYQVDHSKLPSQAPNQLRLIRVIMVSKKTETGVSVTYPSEISLETFFGDDDDDECGRRLSHGLMQPNLDEKYVMGLDVAEGVLFHQIPFEEFVARRGTKSFWVMDDVGVVVSVPCKESESCSVTDGPKNEGGTKRSCDDDDDDYDGDSGGGGRGIGLQVQWVKRRRATFIGKHKERISPTMSMLTVVGVENQDEKMKGDEVKEEEEEEEGWYSGREELKKRKGRAVFKCEKKNKMMVMKTVQKKKKKKKKKRWNNDQDIDDLDTNVSIKEGKGFNPKNRWTEDRYKKAEKNILKVMKAKEAVYGRPILRPDLRAEARKLIGDTGLLDHLLKHMAGKLAPGGKERFRRRHNPEGAMEYWLESAELVNVRKEAGVIDPYWNPPPGWQPGDSPSQDVVCAREIKMLKQDVADMKRKLEEMDDRNGKKQVLMIKGADDDVQNMDASILIPLKVTHEELLKRKAKIDEQLLLVSKALQGMEEDVGKLVLEAKCKAPVASEPQTPMYNKSAPLQDEQDKIPAATKTATTETAKAETAAADQKAAEKEARRQRLKSGFRICKPEGTFLWPANMAASATSSNHLNLLLPSTSSSPFSAVVPTPPSVSSSSAFPPSRHLFFPPVKPVPERPKVVVATAAAAGGCLQLVKDNVCSPTATTGSFSRSSSSSCISSCIVPDLNEVPAGGDYHHLVGFASIDPTPPLQMYKGTRVMHLLPCCNNGYCH